MKKTLKHKSMKKWLYLVVGLGLLAGVMVYVKSVMQPSTVALVGNDVSTGGTCKSNVLSFTTSGGCGNGMVVRADYVCTESGKKGYEGGAGACIDPLVAYERAKQYCGQTCVAQTSGPRPTMTPTPTPTSTPTSTTFPTARPTPTPPPTLDPTAKAPTCKLLVYKRPAGLDGWSEDQRIEPANATVMPGEQLAYAVEVTNPNKYAIGGGLRLMTTNLNGEKEPVITKSWGGQCDYDSVSKTIKCFEANLQIPASSTYRPLSMNIVFQIDPAAVKAINTGIMFTGSMGTVPFNCEPATNISIVQPTPAPGCREVVSPCLKGLVGGSCPTKVICQSPTPTPTPTSTPRACAHEVGNCVTKTNTCLSYTDSCAKSDFCAIPLRGCKPTVTQSPLPVGCRLEQVQCFRAPCQPVITCTSVTPPPSTPGNMNRCFKIWGRPICWWQARSNR